MLENKIFQNVKLERLPAVIVKQIENLILQDELPVGSELPSERELASQLGVSRNILREAMSQLKQKGLLETKPGSGTVIVSPKLEQIQDSLNFLVKFKQHALVELVEARIIIEVEMAGRAAQNATADQIELLYKFCDMMKENKTDRKNYIEADIQFHETIARAAGNEVLLMMLESLRFAVYQNIEFLLEKEPLVQESATQYHYQIVKAIETKDATKAKKIMRKHLEFILNAVVKNPNNDA